MAREVHIHPPLADDTAPPPERVPYDEQLAIDRQQRQQTHVWRRSIRPSAPLDFDAPLQFPFDEPRLAAALGPGGMLADVLTGEQLLTEMKRDGATLDSLVADVGRLVRAARVIDERAYDAFVEAERLVDEQHDVRVELHRAQVTLLNASAAYAARFARHAAHRDEQEQP